MENFKTVGAYWYNRPETLKQCTEQLLDFLIKLKAHNPIYFGTWFELGYSKKDALKRKVEFNYDYIHKQLCKKCKEDEYPETSFRMHVWDGKPENIATTSFSVSLGGSESQYYTNNCIIEFPFDDTKNKYYNDDDENKRALIDLMQDYWHPEWIKVNGKKY